MTDRRQAHEAPVDGHGAPVTVARAPDEEVAGLGVVVGEGHGQRLQHRQQLLDTVEQAPDSLSRVSGQGSDHQWMLPAAVVIQSVPDPDVLEAGQSAAQPPLQQPRIAGRRGCATDPLGGESAQVIGQHGLFRQAPCVTNLRTALGLQPEPADARLGVVDAEATNRDERPRPIVEEP
ncbi:MAG: hypothetical protein AVDCRST_MAG48-3651 [uncultured Friedmanniella sp.]|uniref:Uncharacterized protein n=1 Tax=uncultured Friedmanniella sp. TaxID=335381 RepID=A0A6J4LTV0_9ACTN|nr:MAG: hypothetical protein AVDCRST_MAG48-3651 [uncultured Friedmanniella sp.]